jgi:hypothetical protein
MGACVHGCCDRRNRARGCAAQHGAAPDGHESVDKRPLTNVGMSRLNIHHLVRLVLAAFLGTSLALAGCAVTTVETSGVPLTQPLCTPGAPPVSTMVYWGPQWRADQKEPSLREAAAERGIQDFLSRSDCLAVAGLHRLAAGSPVPSDEELHRQAAAVTPPPDRVVLIVVRELGPRLVVGLPVIVEGGTEVLVEVRVLNAHTSQSVANTRTLWRNGGTFVIKGVKTLEQDMSAALSATLMPYLPAK